MSHTVVLQSDHGPPLDLAAVEAAISTEWLTKALSGAVPGAVVTARRIDRVLVGCSVKVFLSLACNDTALRAGLPTKVVNGPRHKCCRRLIQELQDRSGHRPGLALTQQLVEVGRATLAGHS